MLEASRAVSWPADEDTFLILKHAGRLHADKSVAGPLTASLCADLAVFLTSGDIDTINKALLGVHKLSTAHPESPDAQRVIADAAAAWGIDATTLEHLVTRSPVTGDLKDAGDAQRMLRTVGGWVYHATFQVSLLLAFLTDSTSCTRSTPVYAFPRTRKLSLRLAL